MCIQFVYIDNDAGEGEWQVIVANNRDETYTRPTKPASCWGNNFSCISGMDQEPGREGGTWIGINTLTGKFASLLNILTNRPPEKDKKGRGCLVTEFITGSKSAGEYITSIEAEAELYNPFNFIILENIYGKWKSSYFTNNDDKYSCEITKDVYGVSNSVIDKPWQKVIAGKSVFKEVVVKYKNTKEIDNLQEELISLLNDSTSRLPDPVLEGQAKNYLNAAMTEQRSAIYVDSRQVKYGTRTNTLILIDSNGHGKYIERTMVEPVDVDQPQWNTQTIDFKINGSSAPPVGSSSL